MANKKGGGDNGQGTGLSRWLKNRPEQPPAAAPLPNNAGGLTEYACLSNAHGDSPHYYKRRTGSKCDCGREN